MPSFWKARRDRAAARRKPFVEDPENRARQRDCTLQMTVFDQLTPEARQRIANGPENTDTVERLRKLQHRGVGETVRRALQERELVPSDLTPEQLLSIEIAGG